MRPERAADTATASRFSCNRRLCSRFTAYRLDLVPGTPTSYRYGDEVKEMTSEDVTIEASPPTAQPPASSPQ